nr:DUF4293 domain-containing protein [Pedobacter sp. ASV19]
MIQRIQSVWLLLTSLTLFILLTLPVVSKMHNGIEYIVYTNGLHQIKNVSSETHISADVFMPLMISNAIIALLAFVNIFLFRNRTLQKRICSLIIILIAALNFWIFQSAREIPGGLDGASFGAGAFLPLVAIAFCFLAIRGIRKDEQLIRSADRLR